MGILKISGRVGARDVALRIICIKEMVSDPINTLELLSHTRQGSETFCLQDQLVGKFWRKTTNRIFSLYLQLSGWMLPVQGWLVGFSE